MKNPDTKGTLTTPAPVTPTVVLAFVAQLLDAHASRAVSTQHLALAELLRVARQLPADARHIAPPPVPSVARTVNADGLRYTLAIEDGFVAFRLHDVCGDNALAHLEDGHARQLIADLAAVLAAKEVGRG